MLAEGRLSKANHTVGLTFSDHEVRNVKLYVGGKVFTEEVQAVNNQDAKETALARNPRAKVIGINPIVAQTLRLM